MHNRRLLVRRDDLDCIEQVRAAQNIIYESNYAIGTPQVEALLKPESLVPTSVRVSLIPYLLTFRFECRYAERLLGQAVSFRIQSFCYVSGGPSPRI